MATVNTRWQAQAKINSFDFNRHMQAGAQITDKKQSTQAMGWLAPTPLRVFAPKIRFDLPGHYNFTISRSVLAEIDTTSLTAPFFVVIDWVVTQPYTHRMGILDLDGNSVSTTGRSSFVDPINGRYIVAVPEITSDSIFIVSDISSSSELSGLTGYGYYSIHQYDETAYGQYPINAETGSRDVFAPGYPFGNLNQMATVPGTEARGIFYFVLENITTPPPPSVTVNTVLRIDGTDHTLFNKTVTGGPFAEAVNTFNTTYSQSPAIIITSYNGGSNYAPNLVGSMSYQIITFGYYATQHMQAQVFIRNFKKHFQAQAKIKIVGHPSMMARVVVTNKIPTMQAQALILGEKYLTKYNGHNLPGYAQDEVFDSTQNISSMYGDDSVFSEYTGLENKIISLRMRVLGENYRECKDQAQNAATMLRSQRRTFAPLYIQNYTKHYDALVKSVTLEADVSNNKFVDYVAVFECRPWLIEDNATILSGTTLITTTDRDIYDGGWTPINISITGENVTISGYTATGDFTGFVSVSGVVTNMNINTEEYTSSMSGANRNDLILNDDFQMYVGAGITYFDIDGATDCEITYHNRWLL